MRRATCAALAGLALACGGGSTPDDGERSDVEVSGEEDGAPIIESVTLRPAQPSTQDTISVFVRAYDPDGDPISMQIEWLRNGSRYGDGDSVEPHSFDRGDRVSARVVVTDGEFEVEQESLPVDIGNAPPRVTQVRVTPPGATATNMLIAEAQATDADGDPVALTYRWRVEGEVIEGAETERLAPGIARRGKIVIVEARASDGHDAGDWTPSEPYRMGNAAPQITTQPVYELAGSATYRYDVAATDPDGDGPLKYELVEGPRGMSVDIASGLVTWQVPADVEGRFPVELSVSDPYGGQTLQRYSLAVSWQTVGGGTTAPATSGVAPPESGAPASAQTAGADSASTAQTPADELDSDDFEPEPVQADEFESDDFEPDAIVPDSFDEPDSEDSDLEESDPASADDFEEPYEDLEEDVDPADDTDFEDDSDDDGF